MSQFHNKESDSRVNQNEGKWRYRKTAIVIKRDHPNNCRKNNFDKHQVERFGLYTVCANFGS